MKVIFHPRFYDVYTTDAAAAPGRMESIVKALEKSGVATNKSDVARNNEQLIVTLPRG